MGRKSLDANRGDFAPRPFGARIAVGSGIPAAHAPVHESGGIDPLDLGSIVGEITDAQHGDRAGGTLHDLVTPDPAGVAGFMDPADKAKLDGFPSSVPPTTRQIIAGAGLTGGGDLSADRTLNAAANADGSIVVNADDIQVGVLATDAQHGVRGGGTQHAVATVLLAGFISAADKGKLDSILGTGKTFDYQFGRNTIIPGGGSLQLFGPGPTQTALRLLRAGILTAASIQVGVVDATRTYNLDVRVNGILVQTVPLAISTLGNQVVFAVPTIVAAGDLVTVFMVRTGGVGASTFSDMQAVVEVIS
jgi:hypothetical protein